MIDRQNAARLWMSRLMAGLRNPLAGLWKPLAGWRGAIGWLAVGADRFRQYAEARVS